MWLLLGKVFLVAFPILCARDLYKYYIALKSWTPAKGVIERRKPSGRSVYLVIKFQPLGGNEIEFDSDGFILFLDLFYSKGEEVDILYPPDTPDKAIMKTIYTPAFNLFSITACLYLCYLLLNL